MGYYAHIQKDKKLKRILCPAFSPLIYRKNIPLSLMRSVMGQQLSTKVATVLYNRFLDLFGGMEPALTQVLTCRLEQLRALGLSGAKAQYILNIAAFCRDNRITDSKLLKMGDPEVIQLLTQIKGVGQWTVEMLLMFTLGREDIFPLNDLGIQVAMAEVYGLDRTDKKQFSQKLLQISAKWQPYRTYACLHLWHWKDNPPV